MDGIILNAKVKKVESQLADITTYVYVEKFKVQGDETDDTARIQRAIDSIKTTGGVVHFANKTYNVSSPLKVYSNITLKGVHRVRTQIISQGDIPTIASEGYFSPSAGSSEISIENIGIYPRGVTTKTKYAIEMVNTYNSLIKNCYINELELSTSDVGGIRFSKNAAYTGAHFVNAVRECQIQNASIVMQCTDSYISDCEIWADKRSFAIHLQKSSQYVSRSQIVGSSVLGGIYIKDTIDNYDIELIRISDCYLDGNNAGLNTGIGINAFNMRLSRIVGCDFWLNKDEGLKLTACHSNTVTGCVFENNNRRDASKDDIYMDLCVANTITSNTFKRDVVHTNKGYAIKTTNSPADSNIIGFNSVYFTGNYQNGTASIHANDNAQGNTGMENLLKGVTFTGISNPANNMLYLDSTDGKIKFKDWQGVVHLINTTP